MTGTKLDIHGVAKIEIEEKETAVTETLGLTTVWRHIVITDVDGDKVTITCFAARRDGEKLPVSFVRDLDKESS